MTVFLLPIEACRSYEIKDPDRPKHIKTVRNITKKMRSWLKNRDIEYSFNYVVERYQKTPPRQVTSGGRTFYLGGTWHFEERCELTIPDEAAALQFRLTWL